MRQECPEEESLIQHSSTRNMAPSLISASLPHGSLASECCYFLSCSIQAPQVPQMFYYLRTYSCSLLGTNWALHFVCARRIVRAKGFAFPRLPAQTFLMGLVDTSCFFFFSSSYFISLPSNSHPPDVPPFGGRGTCTCRSQNEPSHKQPPLMQVA